MNFINKIATEIMEGVNSEGTYEREVYREELEGMSINDFVKQLIARIRATEPLRYAEEGDFTDKGRCVISLLVMLYPGLKNTEPLFTIIVTELITNGVGVPWSVKYKRFKRWFEYTFFFWRWKYRYKEFEAMMERNRSQPGWWCFDSYGRPEKVTVQQLTQRDELYQQGSGLWGPSVIVFLTSEESSG